MNEKEKGPFEVDLSQETKENVEKTEENIEKKFEKILDIPIKLKVEIGSKSMSIKEFLSLGKGSIIPLDKKIDEPLILTVNDIPFAEVEVLILDANFGIRILKILEK